MSPHLPTNSENGKPLLLEDSVFSRQATTWKHSMTLTGGTGLCHSAGAPASPQYRVHPEKNSSRRIQIRFKLQCLAHCYFLVNSSNIIISATVHVGFMMVKVLHRPAPKWGVFSEEFTLSHTPERTWAHRTGFWSPNPAEEFNTQEKGQKRGQDPGENSHNCLL